jgi:programmed cell death protein 5
LSELEELRKRREQELQESLQQSLQEQQLREQQELHKRKVLQKLLEPEARERLGRLRLGNPELAEKVEMLILYLYQAGQIKQKITDEQFKELLQKISQTKRETRIRRV